MWLTIRLFWHNHFYRHWRNWLWERSHPDSLARMGKVTRADLEWARAHLRK